jgi:hypothetical protein
VPLRRSNREAAGLEGGEVLAVTLELDAEQREVKPPPDLVKALKAAPPAWAHWGELSYSHQREHADAIEGAKKPETRARRIAAAVQRVAARPARPAAKAKAKAPRAKAAKAKAPRAKPAKAPAKAARPARKTRPAARSA